MWSIGTSGARFHYYVSCVAGYMCKARGSTAVEAVCSTDFKELVVIVGFPLCQIRQERQITCTGRHDIRLRHTRYKLKQYT